LFNYIILGEIYQESVL